MLKSKIRHIMADHKVFTVKQMEKDTGLSRNALNRLYHEKDMDGVSLGTLHRICKTYKGVNICDLVEYIPDPSSQERPQEQG